MAIGTTLKIAFDGSQVDKGARGIKSSMMGIAKVGGKVAAVFSTIASTALVAGITAFAKSASRAAAQMESMQTAFTVLVGDADKARDILEDIREYGARTPFGQADLKEAIKNLLAFGVESQDTMGIIRQLGDVSMGNAEKLQTLSMIFGQIQSGGRMTGAELMRLIKIGFNPLQIIADKTGYSMTFLRDQMSKGNITADMFRETLRIATSEGGLFDGMIEKMADTTEGKFSNMRDAIEQLKISFGKGFNVAVNKALDHINEFLPKFEKSFTVAGDRVGVAIAEAMEGNFDLITDIGLLVGKTLGDAIKVGLKVALRELGKQGNLYGTRMLIPAPLRAEYDKLGMGGKIVRATSELNKRDIQDLLDDARIGINQLLYKDVRYDSHFGTVRPTRAGEEGHLEIDGRWYTMFKQIEINTRQDQPATM